MSEPGASEIPSQPKRKFKPKAPKRRPKSVAASTTVSSSHDEGEVEGVGVGPPLAASGYSHAFTRGGRGGRGWGGSKERGRGGDKGEGSLGRKAQEMMGKQLIGLTHWGRSTKGVRHSYSFAKEVTNETVCAITQEIGPVKAKLEEDTKPMTETEILNAEDDWEDDFGQNTSDSNDPLRPVDLCYDACMQRRQSPTLPGSFLRDGLLSPSHMTFFQLPTKMPSRRRSLIPELEENEGRGVNEGKRTGRGTTKKLDAVTSVHHSHSNNVYAEEEDDVKPDLNTDFPVHGTSMLLNGNESEPGGDMELPFDPAFYDSNIAEATGEEDEDMSKYWPSCRIGRLKVYDNGKMVLKMAGMKFDVTEGQPCGFRQEVAAINTKTRKQYAVGEIGRRARVVPKVETIYNNKHAKK